MADKKKITIVGAGYVGMSLSLLLAQKNQIYVHDIDKEKVQTINSGKPTILDKNMDDFLKNENLSIKATTNKEEAYKDAEFIIIATPTDFDEKTHTFDTSVVLSLIHI